MNSDNEAELKLKELERYESADTQAEAAKEVEESVWRKNNDAPTVNLPVLVNYKDKVLHEPAEKFNFIKPQVDLFELANELAFAMEFRGGIGLAATQIGVPVQVFVMHATPMRVVINPRIIETSPELVDLDEGCLSYPGVTVRIKRPIWIRARYNDINGTARNYRFEGITARIFQHEFDHIVNGTTMLDHVSKLKRDMALKRMFKVEKRVRRAA